MAGRIVWQLGSVQFWGLETADEHSESASGSRWKRRQRRRQGRRRAVAATPKGRQVDLAGARRGPRTARRALRRRDLLIEHLHLIQDRYGHLSAAHLAALAQEMKLALTEVYEVATFYAHFDVVKEGETPPPAVTVRVCDSLSCAMAGAERLLRELPATARARACASCARPAWAPATVRRSAPSATCQVMKRDDTTSVAAARRAWHAHAACLSDAERFRRTIVRDGGYALLKACLAGTRTRDDVIKVGERRRACAASAAPASRPAANGRWCARSPAPRLMAVNADEGEPGTFKDRYYLERDPHRFHRRHADRGLGGRGDRRSTSISATNIPRCG